MWCDVVLVSYQNTLYQKNLRVHEQVSTINFDFCFIASHFSGSAVRNSIRQNIVNLLLATLQQPSPNLAQYLLGFDLQRSISKTVLQDAGKKVSSKFS